MAVSPACSENWHEPISSSSRSQSIRDAPDLEAGQKAVREFLAKFSKEFPGLCKCLTEDLDALLAHLQLPWRLRKFTRTTNLIEHSFVEERRRTKTLPRFFSEKSCLKLVYAVLIRAAARWQASASPPPNIFSSQCSTKNANSLSHRTGRRSPNAQETTFTAWLFAGFSGLDPGSRLARASNDTANVRGAPTPQRTDESSGTDVARSSLLMPAGASTPVLFPNEGPRSCVGLC